MQIAKIDVKKATEEISKIAKDVSPANVNKAIARAINHTLNKAKTDANKMVRQAYKMPADLVRERISIETAKTNTLTGYLRANKFPLPLSAFNPVAIIGDIQTKKTGSFKNAAGRRKAIFEKRKVKRGVQGVTVQVVVGQKKTISSGFIALTKGGNANVKAKGTYGTGGFEFRDEGKSSKLNSKSVFWAIQGKGVGQKLTDKLRDDYRLRLQHELMNGLKYAKPA